jgi:phosphoserine phosphatase
MPVDEPHVPVLSASTLIQQLSETARDETCILAFDGDGTLWSGDVSDDVFLAAATQEWFREDARAALEQVLRTCGHSTFGSLGTLARRLRDAHDDGRVPERLLFEAMTYCYAGHSAAAVTEYAARILEQHRIAERIRFAFSPLLDWARNRGHHCYLVTASPAPIVAVPARALGFDEQHIIASCATDAQGQIRDHVTRPIPYFEQKLSQLEQRTHTYKLLAAFGDSPFDVNLLRAAEIAVAVEPKPGLLAALSEKRNGIVVRWLVNQSS